MSGVSYIFHGLGIEKVGCKEDTHTLLLLFSCSLKTKVIAK